MFLYSFKHHDKYLKWIIRIIFILTEIKNNIQIKKKVTVIISFLFFSS